MDADFDSVWSRVTGTAGPDREQVRLKRWADTETELRALCSGMLRCAPDPNVRKLFRELLSSTDSRLRELSAMSFLRTGQGFPQLHTGLPDRRERREILRECYGLAWELTQDYRRAAKDGRPDFRALCGRLADSAEHLADRLWSLALRSV